MTSRAPILGSLGALALLAAAPRPLAAASGEFDPVLYALEEGSIMVDDCLDCDRPTIEVPISGRFLLRRLPVRIIGELYAIEELKLSGSIGETTYEISGTGTYHRRNEEEDALSLDLVIDGVTGIQLQGTAPPGAVWPALDAAAAEDGTRDPFHLFRVRLVASPVAKSVAYELVPGEVEGFTGSFFTDDCVVCGRLTRPVPVQGSFVLVPLDVGAPGPIITYAVRQLWITGANPEDGPLSITGQGTYVMVNGIILTQGMDLDIAVEGSIEAKMRATQSPFPDGVSFPDIVLTLVHVDPESFLHVFTLQLEARPAKEPVEQAYRRADANADATFDISDPVFTLAWLFSGGKEPPCLDAANSNGDDKVDLTDAVYGLSHRFQGGPAPPAPGPDDCASGFVQLGCDSFAPCP